MAGTNPPIRGVADHQHLIEQRRSEPGEECPGRRASEWGCGAGWGNSVRVKFTRNPKLRSRQAANGSSSAAGTAREEYSSGDECASGSGRLERRVSRVRATCATLALG